MALCVIVVAVVEHDESGDDSNAISEGICCCDGDNRVFAIGSNRRDVANSLYFHSYCESSKT